MIIPKKDNSSKSRDKIPSPSPIDAFFSFKILTPVPIHFIRNVIHV